MTNPQHSCPSPGDESQLSVLFQWRGSVPSSEDCSCYSVHQTTESEPCVMSKTFIFHTAHSHTLAGDEMLLKMQSRRWDETLQRAVGLFHLCGNGPGRIHLVESGGCKEPLKDKGRTEIKLLYLLVVTPRSSSSSAVVTGESAVVMWILVEPDGAWWSLRSCRYHDSSWRIICFTFQAGESAPPHQFTACRYHITVQEKQQNIQVHVLFVRTITVSFQMPQKWVLKKFCREKKFRKKKKSEKFRFLSRKNNFIEKNNNHWKKNIKEKNLLLRFFLLEKKYWEKNIFIEKKIFFYRIFFFLKKKKKMLLETTFFIEFFNWK